jgi:23S rRNA (guanine745-N1)-methyltransferase
VQAPAQRARLALFRCPVCQGALTLGERRLVCAKGHSFDLAKSGYVNLAPARTHAPASSGDTRQQLERRARFLAKGHLDFVAGAIAAAVGEAQAVLDAGCGTGFHLARVVERLPASVGAGIDLSKEAAVWCARRHSNLAFAVADIWKSWPIRDRSLDLVTSIFAPKNYAEMARVLRPGGTLVLVFPGERHLGELRDTFRLLGLSARKAEHYRARLSDQFDEPMRYRMVCRTAVDREGLADAVLMGPNARHPAGQATTEMPRHMAVTIDIEFLFARKRG